MFGNLTGENVHPFESDFTMAEQEVNLVNMTHHLARQQNGVITGFRINHGSPDDKTYNFDTACSPSIHQREMECYLMECVKHHQKLIECVSSWTVLERNALHLSSKC
jgi:hypothetical protein